RAGEISGTQGDTSSAKFKWPWDPALGLTAKAGMTTMSPHRPHIIAVARDWLGTPYHHQASVRGAGCDCIGLVRGIWRELYGADAPEALPAYTRDWAEASGRETMLEAAR